MSEAKRDATERPTERDLRIGKALNDWLDRRARGERVSEEDLVAEHPELAEELRRHVRFLGGSEQPAELIGQLVTRGVLQRSDDGRALARLGTYRITGVLGRGGMGVVLKAHDDRLDRSVALKILRPELTNDAVALQRFAREAKAAATLQHPNVVTVYTVAEQSGNHYIAMEHVDGPSLAELIRRDGPLPLRTARNLFRQILAGLSAAHAAGLIHRDIKPSNVLLHVERARQTSDSISGAIHDDSNSLVKIADFGLARTASAQTRMTAADSILGTPDYMSPEQARGEESIDHRSDLYSAGAVLYEMLTGRPPFKADKPSAVIHRILTDMPPDPRMKRKDVDPNLAGLAQRLMAKEPRDRFDNAENVLAVLDAGRQVVSVEGRRRSRRRAIASVVAIAVMVTGAWLAGKLREQAPIRDLKVDLTDESLKGAILARYGDSVEWKVFHDFGPPHTCVRHPSLVDLDGDGEDVCVVSGVAPAITENCLFAFDLNGCELWHMSMTPEHTITWPDFDGTPSEWMCTALAVANVDRIPGDEVIVSARDQWQYPTCLAIIDPRSRTCKSRFFHTGHLQDVLVVDDYFGQGKPAIIAWGVNNKLDGYRVRVDGASPPLTEYEQVAVVMILDPANLDGLGPPHPPHPNLGSLGTANPWAYAFLNLPSETTEKRGPAWEDPTRTAVIRSVALHPQGGEPKAEPYLEVQVGSQSPSSQYRASIEVTLDLSFRLATTSRAERHRVETDDWAAVWRPIIRNGECLPAVP